MNPERTGVFWMAALVVSLLCFVPTVAQADSTAESQKKVSVDRRLPHDVYALITVPSVQRLKSQFGKSSLGRMIDDKAFDEFRKDINNVIKSGSADIEEKTGLKLSELLSLPHGELSIAVVKSNRNVPSVIVFFDYGKNKATVEKLIALGEKELQKRGLKRNTQTVKNTGITVYAEPTPDGENGNIGSQYEFCWFTKDSTFVFSTELAALTGVLTRWDGKAEDEKTFAEHEIYGYIKQRTKTAGKTPVFRWYVDPVGLLNAALLTNPDAPAPARMALSTLTLLGINRLKAIGGSADLAVGDYDMASKTVLYVEQPTTAVLDMFRFPAVVQSPPKWVSADASSYMQANWDVQQAYKAVAMLYATISLGDSLDHLVDQWAQADSGPKIHLKKDVLDQLTGRIHVATEAADAGKSDSIRVMAAFGVNNSETINTVLSKLAKLPDFPVSSRKFDKHTIYEINFNPALQGPIGGAGNAQVFIGLTVARGHLFISNDVKSLENVIRKGTVSNQLADSKTYKRHAEKFPEKTSLVNYQKGLADMKTLYEQLRSGVLDQQAVGVDFTKLPPFAVVEKYLLPSAGYAVPDKHGVFFHSFSLSKKK